MDIISNFKNMLISKICKFFLDISKFKEFQIVFKNILCVYMLRENFRVEIRNQDIIKYVNFTSF